MKTEIYCDSADLKTIKKLNSNLLVRGFTTNPSLMRIANAKNYKYYSLSLLNSCAQKPISFEVFADNFESMEKQSFLINSWGKNVYVKIPVINSKGFFSGKLIKKLNTSGVKLNITAVYSISQVRQIIKNINKKTKIIISIFAGRMGDAGKNPIPIIKESIRLAKKKKNVEILWASTREPSNYLQAKKLGCQIITMPPTIIEKVLKFGKSLDQLSLETVKKFLKDSKESNFKI